VETEPVLVQVLNIYQTVPGEFPAAVVSTLNNLGILHCVYRQHAQAEHLLTRALAIKEELLASIMRHGVEFRESAPVAHGNGQPKKRNRSALEPWRFESGRWGRSIRRSRGRRRLLPMPCWN
jgi:hypothetical protein